MTIEEFKALPAGTLLKLLYEDGTSEVGEIIRTGMEVEVMFPESTTKDFTGTVFIGLTKGWESLIMSLEVEE